MTKKSLFDTRNLSREADSGQLLYYRLEEHHGLCKSYGVLVELNRNGHWESAAAGRITTSPRRIAQILSLLYRNAVTPCTLGEILSEELYKF